jgi:transposase
VKVTCEAGPTGFGLARFLRERGLACLVAALSKLQRPWGDRVKTDAREAELLAGRIVYTGGRPWTGTHDTWLRGQRFDQPSRQLAFDTA